MQLLYLIFTCFLGGFVVVFMNVLDVIMCEGSRHRKPRFLMYVREQNCSKFFNWTIQNKYSTKEFEY